MLEKIDEDISKIRENINILPHSKSKDKKKYLEYLNNIKEEYSNKLIDIKNIIIDRYNNYLDIKENPDISKLSEFSINYNILSLNSKYTSSLNKMNLDINLYRLKHYYKDDIKSVNNIIENIIKSFKDIGINIKIDDFKYSNYVKNYMLNVYKNKEDDKNLYNNFEKIYWECPKIINLIRLNFYKIYFDNIKNINNYYLKNNKINNNYINTIIDNNNKLEEIVHNDKRYIINKFINNELLLNDYLDTNIDKLMNKYILDRNNEHNYNNLFKLVNNLEEYKGYLKYQGIIDNIKNLYKDKNNYQNIYNNKLKDIVKEEKELYSINSKLNKTSIFKLKDNKKRELLLKVDSLLDNLIKDYNLLEELNIKDNIYKYISDDTNLKDILEIVSYNFKYLYDYYKEENDNLTINELCSMLDELKIYLSSNEFNIINNVKINEDKNISQTITDHYILLNIRLTDEDINENIDSTIKNINTLLYYYDLKRLGIDREVLEFLVQVKKNNII